MYCSRQYLSIDPNKVCHAHKPHKPVAATIFIKKEKKIKITDKKF